MTVRGSADVASIIIDGYNVLGTVTEITDKQTALTEQTDTLGDSWVEHKYVGVRRAEITQRGFYDDAVGSVHAALATGPGNSSRVLTYQPAGTATGAPFKGMTAVQVDYAVETGRAVLHKAVASYLSNGQFDEGKVIGTLSSYGSASQIFSNVLDNGASSVNGGAGYWQLTDFTGVPGSTVIHTRIQHSSDDVTYANLVVFTSATASPRGQRVEVATGTAVERYLRMASSYNGVVVADGPTMFTGFARY